jgi:hypothetical protein
VIFFAAPAAALVTQNTIFAAPAARTIQFYAACGVQNHDLDEVCGLHLAIFLMPL